MFGAFLSLATPHTKYPSKKKKVSGNFCTNYRSELDVYGVVREELLLQVLELLHEAAAAGLHHVLKVERSWLSTVQYDHGAEVGESKGEHQRQECLKLKSFQLHFNSQQL